MVDDAEVPVIDRALVRAKLEAIFAAAAGDAASTIVGLSTSAEDEAVRLRAAGQIVGHFANQPAPSAAVQVNNYLNLPERAALDGKDVQSITIGGEKLILPPAEKPLPKVIRPNEKERLPVRQSFDLQPTSPNSHSPEPRQYLDIEPLKPRSPQPRAPEPRTKIEQVK